MIYKFKKSDTQSVMEIWLQGNIDSHPFIPKKYWESNFKAVQEQILKADIYVYKTENVIQGFIGTQDNYIAGIFVKQESRCNGIGKQLLDLVKARHSTLTLNVYQKNQRAIEFYKREGFYITSTDTDVNTGETDITMCWKSL